MVGMICGLFLVLLMLLVQLVTLYFTGVLLPLGLVWIIDRNKRGFERPLVPQSLADIAAGRAAESAPEAVTAKTHRGSIVDRRSRRSRWKKRTEAGTHLHSPYEASAWEHLQQDLVEAQSLSGSAGRHAAGEAARAAAAMRSNPDGADGLGWLQRDRGL